MSNRRLLRIVAAFLAVFLVAGLSVQLIERDDKPRSDRPLLVAMGDSYTSGNGSLPYDTSPKDCVRSQTSYPIVAAKALGYEFESVACSGAKTDAFTETYEGQAPQTDKTKDADVIVMTIGGNDAGALQSLGDEPEKLLDPTFFSTFLDNNVAPLRPKLDAAYASIKAKNGDAQVFVLGYPNLFPATLPAGGVCQGLSVPAFGQMAPLPVAALSGVAAQLNGTIAEAAAAAGFTYVDVSNAFAGHDVCSLDRWVWGLSDAPGNEAILHPTPQGQAAMAKALEAAIRSKS